MNGCLRVYPGDGGKFVSVAGGRIEDGGVFTEFLKKAAERLGGGDSLAVDVDSEGGCQDPQDLAGVVPEGLLRVAGGRRERVRRRRCRSCVVGCTAARGRWHG